MAKRRYHPLSRPFLQHASESRHYTTVDLATTSLRIWARPIDPTTGMVVPWSIAKRWCRRNKVPFIRCLCGAKIKVWRPRSGQHEGRYIGMCDARVHIDRCGFFIPIQDIDENDEHLVLDYLDPGNAVYRARDGSRPLCRFPVVFQPGGQPVVAVPAIPAIPALLPAPFPMLSPSPPQSPVLDQEGPIAAAEPEWVEEQDIPVAHVLPSVAPPPFNSLRDIFMAGLALQPQFSMEQCRAYRAAQLPDVADPGFELEELLKKLDRLSLCFGCRTVEKRSKMDNAHFQCVAYTCAIDD